MGPLVSVATTPVFDTRLIIVLSEKELVKP
jgi:hypothetical protein